MNENLLNAMAWDEMGRQSSEVFVGLNVRLYDDFQKRQELISKETIRGIHNEALFKCLRAINSTAHIKGYLEYLRFADTLKPNFFDITEALKDFQPTESA